MLDLWEHFRLERHVTGRYWTFEVIPIGESLIHATLVCTLTFLLFGAQPLGTHLAS